MVIWAEKLALLVVCNFDVIGNSVLAIMLPLGCFIFICITTLQVTNASFMDVDESCLNGYVAGCGSVLGRLPPDTSECPLTLYQKVVASVRNNFQVRRSLLSKSTTYFVICRWWTKILTNVTVTYKVFFYCFARFLQVRLGPRLSSALIRYTFSCSK